MKIIGIYKIENLINGKCYIGQSIDVNRRLIDHKCKLNGNYHYNTHLQRSYNKYKLENFKFELICECEIEKLDEKEKAVILLYNSVICGNNSDSGGNSNKTISEETKQLISDKNTGNQMGELNPFYGKKHTDETKAIIKLKRKDRVITEETKRKISDSLKGEKNYFYGKHHSYATKEKLRQANLGNHHTNESRIKMSNSRKGVNPHPHTDATKEKLRQINSGHVVSEATRGKISKTVKLKKVYNVLNLLNTIIEHKTNNI